MNLIQFLDDRGEERVGRVLSSDQVEILSEFQTVYALATDAIQKQKRLAERVAELGTGQGLDYEPLVHENRLLPPIFHPDPAHLFVSGTGLTHLGSADTRAAMHAKMQNAQHEVTDSMRMFQMGVEGGKPRVGESGAQPEWFYKGDGDIVVAPGHPVQSPDFALDLGDEAEIVGIYLIGQDGHPYRLGFALGNEFSDHKTEKINYLYLAHSKLRPCSFGPEMRLGDLPESVKGVSRITRDTNVVWEKEFLSGESHMSHSIANLEYHHFKYNDFLRPGDVHVHFFGTSTLSFGDGVLAQEGDVFELQSDLFGRPLRNQYRRSRTKIDVRQPVKVL